MALDPFLLEVLACPCERHAPVRVDEESETVTCQVCVTTFPIRDGIPVMLLEEATPGPRGVGVEVEDA